MSAQTVRLMAFDVDGVFTDGALYYSADGDALKVFNILDGLGLKLLQKAGIQTAIISGRASPMVERRFTELNVDFVIQNREDKGQALAELARKLNFEQKDLGYMGDDFPDLTTLAVAGFFASVPNAPNLVQEEAAFVTNSFGGHGAVRELCEFLLKAQGFDLLKLFQMESA
ncbi:MAG TPA: HAD family hydrolase [Gammaproteobacteria bacterium]|mgnify:FL=1|nr:HAD family hydrolase [Gammaproteobacteria bacterium]